MFSLSLREVAYESLLGLVSRACCFSTALSGTIDKQQRSPLSHRTFPLFLLPPSARPRPNAGARRAARAGCTGSCGGARRRASSCPRAACASRPRRPSPYLSSTPSCRAAAMHALSRRLRAPNRPARRRRRSRACVSPAGPHPGATPPCSNFRPLCARGQRASRLKASEGPLCAPVPVPAGPCPPTGRSLA